MVGRRIGIAAARLRAVFDERQRERIVDTAIGTAVIVLVGSATAIAVIIFLLGLKAFGGRL